MRHITHHKRGACAMLLRRDGRVLLHLRCRRAHVYPGCGAFFGGGVERGESPFQALCREWREELGYGLLPEHRLFDVAWHFKKRGRAVMRVLDHTFIVHWEPWQRLQLREGQGKAWFTVEAALALPSLPPHERHVLTRLLRKRSML